jgi:hypothetical protein
VCSQIVNIIAPIDLTIGPSPSEVHQWGRGLEYWNSHGGFENDGLKNLKFEFLKNYIMKVPKIQDDLESCILKAFDVIRQCQHNWWKIGNCVKKTFGICNVRSILFTN